MFSEAFAFSAGGAANGAVAGARLGASTAILADIGDDPLSQCVRGALADEEHLHLHWLRRRPGFRSPVSISFTGPHERQLVTYEEPQSAIEWPDDGPTIGALTVRATDPQADWVRRQRGRGVCVYGFASWDATGAWSQEIFDRLPDLDVLVLNEKEARHYARADSVEAAVRALGEHVDLTVVTRGGDGSTSFDRVADRLISIDAEPVKSVDPTGAGDVFLGSLMATDRMGWRLEEPAATGRPLRFALRPHPRRRCGGPPAS